MAVVIITAAKEDVTEQVEVFKLSNISSFYTGRQAANLAVLFLRLGPWIFWN